MKLLLVTPYFFPKIGGLEKYAYDFAIALKKQFRWDIVVVTSNHNAKVNKVEHKNGLKIYRLAPMLKLSNTPINPFWYWKLKQIIRDEKPDLINAHTPVPFIADMAGLAAGKIPFIVTYHAFSLYKYGFNVFNLVITLYKLFEYLLFRRADKILIVSDIIKESIPSGFKKKIIVVNNSLSSQDIPTQVKLTKKSKNIVFIGSLDKTHEWKGLYEILDAIKLYKEKINKDVILSIIGEGDNKNAYQQYAKNLGIINSVKFLGRREGKEKNSILKNSSIGIIYPKSSNDAFPTVALEYWAYSIAIIASDILPINKIIKNKKTGYLINPKNPNTLAETIEYLVTHVTESKNIVTGGYNELSQKYILEGELKKFQNIAKSLTL